MSRKRIQDPDCGIAQSLGLFGDAWTLLIIRNAFFGARRFGDFQRHLGISRNILSDRLRHLVDEGILERIDRGVHGERYEYRLTPKGDALLPVLTSLREWADEWVFGEGSEPLVMHDRATDRRVPKLVVRDADGNALTRHDLQAHSGPGRRTRREITLVRKPRREPIDPDVR